MSFREKFNWAVLVATLLMLLVYGGWYIQQASAGAPVEAVAPVLLAYLAWFIVLIIAAVVFAARDPEGAEASSDERDKMINMKAALPTMHIYGFALTALIAAIFFGLDKWQAFHAIVALQLVATIFEAGAKIHFYRMPI